MLHSISLYFSSFNTVHKLVDRLVCVDVIFRAALLLYAVVL